MIIYPNKPFIPAKPRRYKAPALVLVAASYQSESFITLEFSRAVNSTVLNTSHFNLYDGNLGVWYKGYHYNQLDDVTIEVLLQSYDPWFGTQILFSTDPPTGIVAADNGEVWAGVTDWPIGQN